MEGYRLDKDRADRPALASPDLRTVTLLENGGWWDLQAGELLSWESRQRRISWRSHGAEAQLDFLYDSCETGARKPCWGQVGQNERRAVCPGMPPGHSGSKGADRFSPGEHLHASSPFSTSTCPVILLFQDRFFLPWTVMLDREGY